MRFGENFEIDPMNRINPFEQTERLPAHAQFGKEIRRGLLGTIEKEGWPEAPHEPESAESFFDTVRETVAERWSEGAAELMQERARSWKEPADPHAVEEGLSIHQLGQFESFRENPEMQQAWYDLLAAASERQLAELSLARKWSKELPDAALEKFGVARVELELFIDAAAILGKYTDQAYVKQTEMADAPGGSEETSLGRNEVKGAEYIYDVPKDGSRKKDDVDLLAYREVFPFEFMGIDRGLRELARRAQAAIDGGALPERNRGLSEYLEQLADAYSSGETNAQDLEARATHLDALYEQWRALEAPMRKLLEQDCPIVVVYQGAPSVAGDAEKTDVELRFGIRTEGCKTTEQQLALPDARQAAETIGKRYESQLAEKQTLIPLPLASAQPFAFGPNLHWRTRAEFGEASILFHLDAMKDSALLREKPLVARALANGADWNAESSFRDTIYHELAHAIVPSEDKNVMKRIGKGDAAGPLDELKAEVLGMAIAETLHGEGKLTDEDLEQALVAKIGVALDYLVNRGEDDDYAITGAGMLDRLLAEKVLIPEGEKYEITDAKKGIATLAAYGREIVEQFYVSDESTPEAVSTFIQSTKAKRNNKRVQRLLAAARG